MAQATLHWTPFVVSTPGSAGVVLGQRVEYRDARIASNPWVPLASTSPLSPSLDTVIVPGLLPDVPYDFRVITLCSAGETPSAVISGLSISCPALVVTAGVKNLSVRLTPAATALNVSSYTLRLFDALGNVTIATRTLVASGLTPLTQDFTLLTGGTSYQLKVTVAVGSSTKDCPVQVATTLPDPAVICPAPTGIQAVISN